MTGPLVLVLAGTVVIHDGADAQRSLNAVVRTTGASLPELRTATIPELLGGMRDQVTTGARFGFCEGPPASNADLAKQLALSHEQMLWMEYPRAVVALDGALMSARCLTEWLDPAVMARLHFLRAVAGFQIEGAVVRRNFEQAIALRPDLAWDEDFNPADGRALFEEVALAKQPSLTTDFTVLSGADGLELRVDGVVRNPLHVPLPLGPHLAQIKEGDRVTTFEVNILTRESAVFLSTQTVTESSLSWVFEHTTSEPTASILSSVVARGDTLVAVSEGTLATLEPGDRTWSLRPVSRVPRFLGRTLAWSGVALGAAGVAAMSWNDARANSTLASASEARSESAWFESQEEYEQSKAMYPVFLAASITGGAAIAGGIAIEWTGRRPVASRRAER